MKKRQMALLLALCMVLSLGMTACSNTTGGSSQTTSAAAGTAVQTTTAVEETTAAAEGPIYKDNTWRGTTDPVTLKVASVLHRNGMPEWSEDEISRMIMNTTGVSLKIVQKGDPDGLLFGSMAETLFMKNLYPDIIVVEQEDDIAKLIGSGEVYAIDELVEQYCPEFWDAFDPMEMVNNQSADGHIYAIRTGYRDDAYYAEDGFGISVPRNMVLRSDILEKLGASVPKSVEELESLLYTVRPRVNPWGLPCRCGWPVLSIRR